MKSLKFKDKKLRLNYKKKELMFLWYKVMFFDPNLNYGQKSLLVKKTLFNLKKNSLFKIKNRCNVSNRGLAVYSKFGLSRIALRNLSSGGLLNGIQKASW